MTLARCVTCLAGSHSVALMAGLVFMPLVIGAGFLSDRGRAANDPVPVSIADLRGTLDPATSPR